MLHPVSTVENGLPSVPRKASLYDALATMLTAGANRVLVVGDDGAPAGVLHRDALGDQ
jgi:CBS domain-containing protein